MVYRQTRSPDGNTSGLVQVTPMIDRVHWATVYDEKGTQFLGYRLRDPFVWAFADASQVGQVELVFYDRTGLLNDYDYRYQVVYFDADKRLQRWRATDWVTYQSGVEGITVATQEEE
jgi:hypothetical protein